MNQFIHVKSLHDAFFTIFTKRWIQWYSSFVGSLEDYKQDYCFPISYFVLIATSLILLISVPIIFASSDGWSNNKNVVFSGTSLWIGLAFLVAILNSLIS